MEEENVNFSLHFDFLEDEVEAEAEVEQARTDNVVDEFVRRHRNASTVRKTESDCKKFSTFIQSEPYSETRKLTEIPPQELDKYLCHFLLEIRKADGGEYEPDSLTSIRNSLERFLREQQYKYSLIESREFSKHREVLKAKRKELKSKGKGRKPNAARPLSKEDRTELYKKGYLGCKDSETLQTTVWLNNTLHFGMRSCQEHYDLQWGDVTEKSSLDGKVYLEMEERISKGRDGQVPGTHSDRAFKPKMFHVGGPQCPVEVFRFYRQHRPESMCVSEAPFYLQTIKNPTGDIWFKKQRLGKNSLGKLLKEVGDKAGLNIRNHSGRKTMVTDLCDANVPSYRIIQLSGHKSVESIQDYHKKAKFQHQEEMSNILRSETTTSEAVSELTQLNSPKNFSSSAAPVSTQLFGPNTSISGGNITVNFIAGQTAASKISSPPRTFKRLRAIIESDSSQELE